MEERPDVVEGVSIEAEYALESPLKCSTCHKQLTAVHVVRLLRSKVNFTSTLPRKGYVMLCPSCQTILSANLGGI